MHKPAISRAARALVFFVSDLPDLWGRFSGQCRRRSAPSRPPQLDRAGAGADFDDQPPGYW